MNWVTLDAKMALIFGIVFKTATLYYSNGNIESGEFKEGRLNG